MQNKLSALLAAFLLVATVSACSFPGVYKISVQQGNIVTEEMLAKLKRGMTRKQIHFVLGYPVVENAFNENYENFIYTYQPPNEETQQQIITVYYQNGIYTHHEGTPLAEHSAY
jgi:outer membrane protein assembly factor BamE